MIKHKLGKKQMLFSLFLAVIILACSLLSYHVSEAATYVTYDSSYATWNVELANGEIIIHNYDKTRSSSIAYKTIGFTVSRCKLGQAELYNGTASEWIALDIVDNYILEDPEQVITTDNKQFTHTKWTISLQSICDEMIRLGFYDWANEVKACYIDKTMTDQVVYLKFDSIMCTVIYSDTYPLGIRSGNYDCKNRRVLNGTVYTNTPLESNLPETHKNPYQLKHAYAWANPSSIDHHYNRYLPESNATGGNPSGGTPLPGVAYGSPVALYETKNYSNVYNISKAIPSGEKVNNAVSASSVNGNIGVQNKTETKDYSVNYRYYYLEKNMVYNYVYIGNIYIYQYVGSNNIYTYVGSESKYKYTYVRPTIGYTQKNGGSYIMTSSGPKYVGPGKGTHEQTTFHHGDYNSAGNYVGPGKGDYKREYDGTQGKGSYRYNGDGTYTYVGPNNGEYEHSKVGNGDYNKISAGSYGYVGEGNGAFTSAGKFVGHGYGDYRENHAPSYVHVGSNNGEYIRIQIKGGDYNKSGDVYTQVGQLNGNYYREEVWDGTYKEVDIETHTFNYTASITYQYINSVNIQAIDSMTVNNGAFPGGSIDYTKTELTNTNVSASLIMRSQSAINAGRGWDTISSGVNLAGYNFTPNSNHYSFPSEALLSNKSIQLDKDYTTAELTTQKNNDAKSIRDLIGNNLKSRNDAFTLNDNGTVVVFMQDTECSGGKVYDATNTWTYGTQASDSIYRYGANGQTLDSYINNLKAARATSAKQVTIPVATQNLDYPTGMTASYTSLFHTGDITLYAGQNYYPTGDSIYNHVMSGGVLSEHNGGDPNDGYPIRVHTPVVSPFEIVFNDLSPAVEDTQLTSTQYNTSAEYQLLLDRSYYIKWDNNLWLSNIYGDVNYGDVFDRYVAKKTVRFPFAVVYNGTLYEVNASGYTPWIEVQRPDDYTDAWDSGVNVDNYESNNHWKMTPFYIPSFAEEGGWIGNNKTVEVAVYAYNFTGTDISDDLENAVNIIITNGAVSDYIATTKKQVQLSGWMYDFTIVGTSNQAMYTGTGLTSTNIYDKIGNISLAALKFELKTGVKNRLGTTNIRYLSDGTVNNAWSTLQTIPMREGQSFAFSNLGKVWKGQTFAYTIKTISNLNGKNDYIRITPAFKYVTPSGEVLSSETGDFKMYEVTDTYIKEFDPSDISIANGNYVTLSNSMFDQSYYDTSDKYSNQQLGDWVTASVNKENSNNAATGYYSSITKEEFMSRPILSYNLDSIYIPASLRYMSGEYEQLQINDGKSYDRVTGTTTLKTYWDTISNYTTDKETNFKYSMQQWQSCYVVPSNVYIVDTRGVGGATFDIYDYIEHQQYFNWEECPIVTKDDGQLIIGFDITAYRDGTPYLEYDGGNNILNPHPNDMWDTEESEETPPIIEEDDVAIVDMSKSITDYYESAIMNIN